MPDDRDRAARLDPGSREILGARRLRIDFADPDARWTCTRCARSFPVAAGWGVETVGEQGRREVRFIVCSRCAPVFERPPGLAIDLVRLRARESASLGLITNMVERVEGIARSRGELPTTHVAIRAVDIREHAVQHAIAPLDLARLLVDEDVAWPL